MTAPGQVYGYVHRGTITGPSELPGYWFARVTALNPARPVGPYASTVPDLQVGDRVLLTQIGTSRDDLVVTGKLPPTPPDAILPIGMDDVTGLPAALDARVTDAEFAVFQAANTAELDDLAAGITGHGARLDGHDTAISGLSAADSALDGRLDVVEPTVAGHTTSIGTNTTDITSLTIWSWRAQDHDADMYGDLLSAYPRLLATNLRTLPVTTALVWRTRVRRPVAITSIRMVVTTAGVGGTATGALYVSSSALGAYSLRASTTSPMSPVGPVQFTLPSQSLVAGDYVLALVWINGAFTTAPQVGTVQVAPRANVHNPAGAAVWATKTGGLTGSLPASINLQDGSWSPDNVPWWIALG